MVDQLVPVEDLDAASVASKDSQVRQVSECSRNALPGKA
jgi:hypothetical protein